MATLTQQQQELARVRRIKPPITVDPDKPQRKTDPFRYDRAEIYIRERVLFDPNRRVLPRWKRTLYDGKGVVSFISTDQGEKIDAGDGVGISIDEGGPFKLRVLKNIGDGRGGFLGIGAVIEKSAVEYALIRSQELRCATGAPHRYEPVPDDVELRPTGVLPKNFPSHMPKARKLAAQGLKKPEQDLTFAEIVKFFEQGGKAPEIFGANGKHD
jgi:hypothetical protein